MKRQRILSVEKCTHNVVKLKIEKPEGLAYVPGQAADVALDRPEWAEELRPFTFTSLPHHDTLEFVIKVYPDHKGVTEQIGNLKEGDHLMIGDVFGDINYKGPGVFIAGGAGVTPFISIFKKLNQEKQLDKNKLIFANSTEGDIIERDFFEKILGNNFINVLSKEKVDGMENGFITKELISKNTIDSNSYFYLCGPPPMMNAVLGQLAEMGVPDSRIVHEEF